MSTRIVEQKLAFHTLLQLQTICIISKFILVQQRKWLQNMDNKS